MVYKGYVGHVVVDEEAGLLHGRVINTRDVITFEGRTVEELKKAFRDSVEDYLEFCAERGEEPERPYSGEFRLRLPPALHRAIVIAAAKRNMSINRWVCERLQEEASAEQDQDLVIAEG